MTNEFGFVTKEFGVYNKKTAKIRKKPLTGGNQEEVFARAGDRRIKPPQMCVAGAIRTLHQHKNCWPLSPLGLVTCNGICVFGMKRIEIRIAHVIPLSPLSSRP